MTVPLVLRAEQITFSLGRFARSEGGFLSIAVVLALGTAVPLAMAQAIGSSGAIAQPVVQALPNRDALTLNEALARLARNPRDASALIDAGNAALAVGDVDAAIGFFSRASQVTPANPMVKAGLASALVQSGNPFDAIPMFEDAERAGATGGRLLLDRGLAYDLVGDNAKAQGFYRQVLAGGPDDEAARRLSLSQAISGDRAAAEATLSPLLQRQDKAAWRVRAFSLAILGQTEEAVSIANAMLPNELASGISPYLRYMPRLTVAQQAAAANFGQFPRASEIGQDDPRVALYAPPPSARRPRLASGDAALTPSGEPLGRRQRARQNRQASSETRRDDSAPRVAAKPAAPPVLPQPTREATPAPRNELAVLDVKPEPVKPVPVPVPVAVPAPVPVPEPVKPPVVVAASVPPAPVAAPVQVVAPVPVVAMAEAKPVPTPSPVPVASTLASSTLATAPTPGFDLGKLPDSTVPPSSPAPAVAVAQPVPVPVPAPVQPVVAEPAAVPAPALAPVPAPDPARRPSLADAFSEFSAPAADAAPAAGAVDMRNFRPSRETTDPRSDAPAVTGRSAAAAKPAATKPAPPSHPSRIWVQLATGRDKAALGFDWRRMSREAEAVFRGKRPSISVWGQSNRLLAGPFDTAAAANAFVTQLRRADIGGAFVWTSPAGQVVDVLTVR